MQLFRILQAIRQSPEISPFSANLRKACVLSVMKQSVISASLRAFSKKSPNEERQSERSTTESFLESSCAGCLSWCSHHLCNMSGDLQGIDTVH